MDPNITKLLKEASRVELEEALLGAALELNLGSIQLPRDPDRPVPSVGDIIQRLLHPVIYISAISRRWKALDPLKKKGNCVHGP